MKSTTLTVHPMGEEAEAWLGVYMAFAVLGILASSSIIVCFLFLPELLKRSLHRLLFCLSISDFFQAISCCIWFSGGVASGARCGSYFFLFYTFRNASILLELVIYFSLLYLIRYGKGLHKSTEMYLVLLSFLIPFITTVCIMSTASLVSRKYLVDDERETDDFALTGACFISDSSQIFAVVVGDIVQRFLPVSCAGLMVLTALSVIGLLYSEQNDFLKKCYEKAYRRVKFYLVNFVVFHFIIASISINGRNWTFKGCVVLVTIVNAGIFFGMNKKITRKFKDLLKERCKSVYNVYSVDNNEKGEDSKSKATGTANQLRETFVWKAFFHENYKLLRHLL